MNFREFINEGLQIIHIDPEEDWEMGNAAYEIAQKVRIRPDRTKSPTIIALNDKGDVIGAAFTSWDDDDDASQHAGERVGRWEFDVVVDPDWQGYEMVGMKLIRSAEEEREQMASTYDSKAYTKLWVVNPKLAKVLQTRKYGYSADTEYPDGSAHLTKF